MPHMKFITKSEAETRHAGEDLVSLLVPELEKGNSVLVLLNGDFGAGKTQFVKGMGKVLGVKEEIVSPSYVYICEYPCKLETKDTKTKIEGNLIHVDAWRVKRAEDLELIGLKDYIKPGNLVAVEWPLDNEQITDSGEQLLTVKVDFKEISETEREIVIDYKA